MDPYPHENISPESAIENFIEIIEFAKTNENVTLLLGNHDFMTYLSTDMGNCRTDFENAPKITKLFKDNFNLFKVAVIRTIDNTNYCFSHAPILKTWIDDESVNYPGRPGIFYNIDKDINSIVNQLNSLLHGSTHGFNQLCISLNYVGFIRGGWSDCGSVVWADLREVSTHAPQYDNVYMIFGHTQLRENEIITPYIACLDCRKGFRLDENEEIYPITE